MDNLSGNTNKSVVKPAVQKELTKAEKEAQKEAENIKAVKGAIREGFIKAEKQLKELLSKELRKANFSADDDIFKNIKDLATSLSNQTKKVVDKEKAEIEADSEIEDRYKL